MYIYSLVSVFCFRNFSVKLLKIEIYIILCRYSYHSFIKGFKNKINFVKLTFWTASYGNESKKSVGYAKYTMLNIVLFLHLIG